MDPSEEEHPWVSCPMSSIACPPPLGGVLSSSEWVPIEWLDSPSKYDYNNFLSPSTFIPCIFGLLEKTDPLHAGSTSVPLCTVTWVKPCCALSISFFLPYLGVLSLLPHICHLILKANSSLWLSYCFNSFYYEYTVPLIAISKHSAQKHGSPNSNANCVSSVLESRSRSGGGGARL